LNITCILILKSSKQLVQSAAVVPPNAPEIDCRARSERKFSGADSIRESMPKLRLKKPSQE